jgi:hypothetical protein
LYPGCTKSRSEPIRANIAARLLASFHTLLFPNLVQTPNEPTKGNPNNSKPPLLSQRCGWQYRNPKAECHNAPPITTSHPGEELLSTVLLTDRSLTFASVTHNRTIPNLGLIKRGLNLEWTGVRQGGRSECCVTVGLDVFHASWSCCRSPCPHNRTMSGVFHIHTHTNRRPTSAI